MSCLRPSNRSSRPTLPLGPSNSYFFSTAVHGMRRRSAASPSRDRVKAFSFTSNCCRAASHSCCDTIGGVFLAVSTFGFSLSLSLLVPISFLLCFLQLTETTRSEKFSAFADAHRQNSSCGSGRGDHHCCACDACRAHMCLVRTSNSFATAGTCRDTRFMPLLKASSPPFDVASGALVFALSAVTACQFSRPRCNQEHVSTCANRWRHSELCAQCSALSEPGCCLRNQEQPYPDHHNPDGSGDALAVRCDPFGRDCCRNKNHYPQIHDPDDEEDRCKAGAAVSAVEAEAQPVSPSR